METTNYRKPSLQDYLLVEYSKRTGRVRLVDLDSILLPITEGGPVEDLEAEIDYLSSYLVSLSSTFANEHQTIQEINNLYEQKNVTDYMLSDPSIINQDRIQELVTDADLALLEDVQETYDTDDKDETESVFDETSEKIDSWYS